MRSQPAALSLLAAIREVDGVVAVRDRLSYPRRERPHNA
jgi:hypothetical protein